MILRVQTDKVNGVGGREASRRRLSHEDVGVWYGGAMPWSGLRNVVRCPDSGTVAGVWFQVQPQ
jgi:hypothetical protein